MDQFKELLPDPVLVLVGLRQQGVEGLDAGAMVDHQHPMQVDKILVRGRLNIKE